MEKNRAFTLIELVLSLALFALVSIMLLSLLNFATSSTTDTERAAEAVSNSSATKELLVRTISPSTSIEILEPITTNDLTAYIETLNESEEHDEEYTYLYSIDGVVFYRNPGTDTVGSEIRTISTTDVDLGFSITPDSNDRILNIDMTFSTKEIEPYVLEDTLSIVPLNFATDQAIIDDRENTGTPSNIIRFISEEIVMDNPPVVDETPIILSATVYDVPITGSPDGKYNVPFYVSQKPRVIQLYNYSTLADQGNQITPEATIDNPSQVLPENKPDLYFKNNVIGQSTFLAKEPTTKVVSFVYKGYKFIDIYGNEYVGTENGNGTRTIEYVIPTYSPTPGMQFAVTSLGGAYVAYDFKVISGIPKPEIIRFEFLPEDNDIPYRLKTYINENDVYYTKKSWDPEIPGTEGASRPKPFSDLYLGNQNIINSEAFYSTIVMPTNRSKIADDYYPTLGQYAHGTGDNFLNSRVATITFRGTSLIVDGNKVVVPEPEQMKLNGVEEVTVKVSIDEEHYKGDIYSLDGEKYADVYKGTEFENYTFPAYGSKNSIDIWFDPQNDMDSSDQKGHGYIFTVLNGNEAKRYTYQHEASTTKPDFHKSATASTGLNTADSGLNRIWVDNYMEGAWVGGSMRSDVSGDIVVTVPYDKYDSIKDNLTLKASVYGKQLVQLPSYPYGTYSRPGGTLNTDNYSYYNLAGTIYNGNNTTKTEVEIKSGTGPYSTIRYNAAYLKHFVLIQNGREYGPMVRYQVRIEKSYPKGVLEPKIENVKIYEETVTNKDKTFIKNGGAFVPSKDMESTHNIGDNIDLNVAFAGSKIRIGTSINPALCDEFVNGIDNKDVYYEQKLSNLKFGTDYFIHVYDYQGAWKEAYRITTKTPSVRSTTVYDFNTEISRSPQLTNTQVTNNQYYLLPFLPVKTELAGVSYGFHTDDTTSNVIETPIRVRYSGDILINTPVPYVPNANGSINTNVSLSREPKVIDVFTATDPNGTKLSNDWRMYIRSTRTNYNNGGNNINTASQYRITNFMTPVMINTKHLLTGTTYSPGTYNTDNWVGKNVNAAIAERKPFEASNVKLDTQGFSVQIFNDRVYSQTARDGTITPRSTGRPGTVVETNFDIAIVDVTTGSFNTESYSKDQSSDQNADISYELPHDNSAIPAKIQTNDVLGYGFSLIEQNVDRDPYQDNLGSGTEVPDLKDREVALMFYVRHFVADNGTNSSLGIDLGKVPGSYVKLADLTGFDSAPKASGAGDTLYSQSVNFKVDVQTTFDGKTIITEDNYYDVMTNNYIGFTVTELDIKGNPTGKVHFKLYSFADVFGGVRVDDHIDNTKGYNELNLILNHIPRQTKTNTGRLAEPRLSVGYGTNWGLVGISDFKIMR